MNIILNEAMSLRMTCSEPEHFHSLEEINFYIPKVFSSESTFSCIIDDEFTISLKYSNSEIENYYIFLIEEVQNDVLIHKGLHSIKIQYNNQISNSIEVMLKEYYHLTEDDKIQDNNPIVIIANRKILICNNNYNTIIAGDNKSQLITFKLNRFYDGVDLADKNISINYVNALGEKYQTNVTNLQIFNDYILFSWLITSTVSAAAGTVIFNIIVSGEIGTNEYDTYTWQTMPAKLTVIQNLNGDIIEVEPGPNSLPQWYLDLMDVVNEIYNKIDTVNEDAFTYWEDV